MEEERRAGLSPFSIFFRLKLLRFQVVEMDLLPRDSMEAQYKPFLESLDIFQVPLFLNASNLRDP